MRSLQIDSFFSGSFVAVLLRFEPTISTHDSSSFRLFMALRSYTFKKIFFRQKNQSRVQQISTAPSE